MSVGGPSDLPLAALLVSIAVVGVVFAHAGVAGILAIITLFTLASSGFLFYTLVLPRIGGFWR